MGSSKCYSLMKCLLILFNIIFLGVGCAACGFAVWALWDGRASEGSAGRAGLCAVGAWGAALGAGALLALCGAARGSASLLAGAFALLALSAVAEGAAAWWGAAHLPQLRHALRDRLEHVVRYDYGLVQTRTHMLDAIQQGLECCGAESTRDWQSSLWSAQQQPAEGGEEPAASARAHHPLDLSVGAEGECDASRRVPASAGGARGLHAAPCGPRVVAALERRARLPLGLGAALLATHAVALLLTLALCLRAHPHPALKA
ncbi:hypothetical protein K1T71_001024 [Dendrolimus kikuchii]|uniref:Uncharacterized protein n=1 Tax=Dendrolimus kikuchii TaxID=765133 RepID=A0ACC1DGG9_9NEOP|nr:hypothetical protein K1T71_001024 [Dendrolimus kikuchii]